MESQARVFDNVFYYLYNAPMTREGEYYYPNVVLKADWKCGRDHIKNKWVKYFLENHDIAQTLLTLYANLDNSNRKVFTNWVMENYHGSSM